MMPHPSSEILLRDYVRQRSERAFRELVALHSPLVYGTALRWLEGDRQAAEDVMQEVFTLLVRKAAELEGVVLSAWLYRQACRRAANYSRSERRRKKRERVAAGVQMSSGGAVGTESCGDEGRWSEIDRAFQGLLEVDRGVLTLRFFEGRDFTGVSSALGISEAAARKRVARALEKLEGILKRRGILAGAASLGTAMSGMAQAAVPEMVVSRVASQALKALPAGGWGSLLPLLKAFFAGLVMTGLGAAAVDGLQRREPEGESLVVKVDPPSRKPVKEIAQEATPDNIIRIIKRLHAGPENAVTDLRLAAELVKLPVDRIPEFFELAATGLTMGEKNFCYGKVIGIWMKSEPERALSYVLNKGVGKDALPLNPGSLVVDAFGGWMERDPVAAQTWLLASWRAPGMAMDSIGEDLKQRLAQDLADHYLWTGRLDEAMALAHAVPDAPAHTAVLKTLGGSSMSIIWMQIGETRRLELYRALASWSDPASGQGVAQNFLEVWARNFPDELRALKSRMVPGERFRASIALVGISPPQVEKRGGETMTRYPSRGRADFVQVEEETLVEGVAAGLSRSEALQVIGAALLSRRGDFPDKDSLRQWMKIHQGEVDLDQTLAARVWNEVSQGKGITIDGASSGERAIEWASYIRDPEQRRTLARAAFRTMLGEDRQVITDYLAKEAVPTDLAAEFQSILEEQP